ncbi:signal transduction protein with CBS domains [Halosimplex carlsbadense 2-9-1]|uniref:Signal transduction protein with CBS domains n=1 Tax=Halosimplex carlsbadense 2-9-1 TaxID=797114 RepID=M0CLX5_9EURY|nr:CBS domain-containing protein [Halosimplex carlsbadense]ELZ24275.1 signal transduction protein with CBS domains [Halosimplex carlsbadense 2-9-1]
MEPDASVREVMDREFVGVSEADDLEETAELMLEEGTDSAVVLRGSDPVGVVTERDALAAFVDAGEDSPSVSEAMTDALPTVSPEMTIAEAADELSVGSTQRALVSDGDEPLGVLTERDLLTASPLARTANGAAMAERERAVAGVTEGRGNPDAEPAETRRSGGSRFEDQSLCEACGSLSRELSPFNGQLLCPDCRDI